MNEGTDKRSKSLRVGGFSDAENMLSLVPESAFYRDDAVFFEGSYEPVKTVSTESVCSENEANAVAITCDGAVIHEPDSNGKRRQGSARRDDLYPSRVEAAPEFCEFIADYGVGEDSLAHGLTLESSHDLDAMILGEQSRHAGHFPSCVGLVFGGVADIEHPSSLFCKGDGPIPEKASDDDLPFLVADGLFSHHSGSVERDAWPGAWSTPVVVPLPSARFSTERLGGSVFEDTILKGGLAQRACFNHRISIVQLDCASQSFPSETARRPSHRDDDTVRSSWRHEEDGRNDRLRSVERVTT